MVKVKTIGFFGGSFDPIHVGHLNLAIELAERCSLDEILFCPTFCSPFKMDKPPLASPLDRLEMVKAAIDGLPQFKVTSLEIERKGPSFTIDTLRLLQEPTKKYHLILSQESAAHFHLWKEAEELLRLAPPLIGIRDKAPSIKEQFTPFLVPTPLFDVTSTNIRERLKKRLYCGHLVPQKVLDYIALHKLYYC